VVIADEMQNATKEQMKTLLTRIGRESYIILTGDPKQTDISSNGLHDFITRLPSNRQLLSIKHIKFDHSDIKRDEVVKDILDVYDNSDYPSNCLL